MDNLNSRDEKSVYDLVVIGNGIAAQFFLWNLSSQESKSQNFSIAHVYSNEITPACSLKSTATVSLNGIEENVSQLGDDMREAYFLFENLFNTHKPQGVQEVKRTVLATNEDEIKKLNRRYKKLIDIKSEYVNSNYSGAEYNSFMITPEVFSEWLIKSITVKKDNFPFFVRDVSEEGVELIVKLQNGEVLRAKKILFATGAFAKIFEKFYLSSEAESIELKNMIKAGFYLERSIDLGNQSFYLTIDGNEVLYRKNSSESKLIIGSHTAIGAYEVPDVAALTALIAKLSKLLTFDIGVYSDFKLMTGLRHKGPKRLLICETIDLKKRMFRINGLYKNGFTLGLLAAKRMQNLIFNP